MIVLRWYQEEAKRILLKTRRGIVVVPAGGGKTIIAASSISEGLLKSPAKHRKKILWIANTQEQCQQAESAIALFPAIKELSEITVCCAASEPFAGEHDLLIVDECHHAASESWRRILLSAKGAIWGFTATPDREDGQDITTIVGEIVYRVGREALLESQSLSHGRVEWLCVNGENEIMVEVNVQAHKEIRKWMNDELKNRIIFRYAQLFGIVKNEQRNLEAIRVANKCVANGDSVLLLVGNIEHGMSLSEKIQKCEMCYSGMGKKKRRTAIQNFRLGETKCLVATQLADEGLDVPRANVLILVSGGRASGKIEQRTGRVLRFFEQKIQGTIYDFIDIQHPMLFNQSLKREKIYSKLGYSLTKIKNFDMSLI